MVNGESTSIFLLVNYNANSSSKLSVIHLNRRPTPSAVVIPDGGWLNTATIDWMVSGENSAILLFLKYNVLLTSTLSVFSYQFGLLVRKIRFPLLPIDHSQLTIRLHSRRAAAVVGLIDQQPNFTACFSITETIRLHRFACWSKRPT